MTRAVDRPPPEKRTPPGEGGVKKKTRHIQNGNSSALVHRMYRYCTACGAPFAPEHPKHDLCAACHKWFRIRWLSGELAQLAREVR